MNITFEVTPARPVPATPTVTDLLITVTPAATPGPAPLDLALVIDTSGSMGGLPLEMARAAATGLLTRLGPDDRAALVTFSGGPVLHAPLQPVGDGRTLQGHLSRLRATGSTALHAGWQLGAGLLLGARHPHRLPSVLLLTDGRPNVGEHRPAVLTADLAHALTQGVSTSVVGTGLRYNECLLEQLAGAGDGHFHHAERSDGLPALFQTELAHLQRTVARHATLRADGLEVLDVLNDLPRSGYDLRLPPLQAGQPLRLVCRVRVSGGQSVGFLLTWTDLQGEAQAQPVTFTVPLLSGAVWDVSTEHPAVVQERLSLLAARAQRELAGHLDTGDVGQALDTLTRSRRHLLRAQARGVRVAAELEELGELERRVARGERQAVSKQARSQAYGKSTGRK